MSRRVLITVSGFVPAGADVAVAARRRPRIDYVEISKVVDADILDYSAVERIQGQVGRLVQRIVGRNAALALQCVLARRKYDVILTDGEQIGLPFAVLASFFRRTSLPRHVMIVHVLSVTKKSSLYRFLRLGRRIDEMVVYSSAQRDFISGRLGYPAAKITLSNFMVDTAFFDSTVVDAGSWRSGTPVIAAAGLEFRDYPTMLKAVDGLNARVVLAAASPWSKRSSALEGLAPPTNVEIVRLDLAQLRELYRTSTLVVVPLCETDFQAGVTTLLEAMSMGKPVICSRTSGQTDVIVDGVTGVYVPPSDASAMRLAIEDLLADPARADAIGSAARQWVVGHADIDVYVAQLGDRINFQQKLATNS